MLNTESLNLLPSNSGIGITILSKTSLFIIGISILANKFKTDLTASLSKLSISDCFISTLTILASIISDFNIPFFSSLTVAILVKSKINSTT